jgi:hypothetical protein
MQNREPNGGILSEQRCELELDAPPKAVLAAVTRAASDWGADWSPATDGGRLHLPVVAGLRRGLLTGRLEARGGTRITLHTETTLWRVHRSAAAILVLGALGALPVILWPLREDLLALAPAGLVLMFLAWFMVVSRLRSAGADEFLEAVRDRLEPRG